MSKKKGSLNLSINAIVVLILAITMLGLGLAFMKGMFKKTTSQFDVINQDLKNTMIAELRDTNGRIVLNKEVIEAKKGDNLEIYYGLRNDLGQARTFSVLPLDTAERGEIADQNSPTPGKWSGNYSIVSCYDAISGDGIASGKNQPTDDITFETIDKKYLEDGEVGVWILKMKIKSQAKTTTYQCSMIVEQPAKPVPGLTACNPNGEREMSPDGSYEEDCDDGNSAAGDGCDPSCKLEAGGSRTQYDRKDFQITVKA